MVSIVDLSSARTLTLLRYKRREMGERTAILSCGQCSPCVTFDEFKAISAGGMVSSVFGPLLASAILDSMDGVLGQAGWR